jgi:Immunity protein 50
MDISFIKNNELVLKAYGRWPSFHDFEIVKVEFDRALDINHDGPFITVHLHMWQIIGKTEDGKHFRFSNHHMVTLRFNRVAEYTFEGFNHQNAIDDWEVEAVTDDRGNLYCHVTLPALYGVDMSIKCQAIEVLSITPGMPRDSVYKNSG